MPPPDRPRPPVDYSGTVVESEDEIRQAIAGLRTQPMTGLTPPASQPPTVAAREAVEPASPPSNSRPFRPTVRPPAATLTVFDDGKADGEVIRIRSHRFVIGRTEGDLVIPIDGRISSKHVEIALTPTAGGGPGKWVITDLQSRHGLFVRVTRTVLNDGSEFLVGNGRYLFRTSQAGEDTQEWSPPAVTNFSETQPWDDRRDLAGVPSLTEMVPDGAAGRFMLLKPEYWIGSDPRCTIPRVDDPFCEPRHARLHRNAAGAWHAEHDRTLNGLWVRMPRIAVEAPVRFQIGEQRFQLKVQ